MGTCRRASTAGQWRRTGLRRVGHGRSPSSGNREGPRTGARARGGPAGWPTAIGGRSRVSGPKPDGKPFVISKRLVWEAYLRVKANKGAAGVDGQSILEFEANLRGNLYKLWNRLSSGSYMPPPVRAV